MKKILIISPHLDDETLGVGGTIKYHKSIGDEVYWINVTLPEEEGKKKRRLSEQKSIACFFKFEKYFQMNYTSTTLEGKIGELVFDFTNLFKQIQPNIIYLPNRSDVHSDHRIIFQAAYSSTKSFRHPYIKRILMYETLSETEFSPALNEQVFLPNVFVNISDFIEAKLEAMKIYQAEMMESNYPRSIAAIKSLAHFRGIRIGCMYAESFMLIFEKN